MRRNGNARNVCVFNSSSPELTDQNWIPKTIYCIRCVMVCKIGFSNWNATIALLGASMVVIYYIKLFRTRADRHNDILMSLLLLVAETKKIRNYLPSVNLQKQPRQVLYEKRRSQKFHKIHRHVALLNKRLWHKYFTVNFAKFLRTPFLQNTSGRLLLNFSLRWWFSEAVDYRCFSE